MFRILPHNLVKQLGSCFLIFYLITILPGSCLAQIRSVSKSVLLEIEKLKDDSITVDKLNEVSEELRTKAEYAEAKKYGTLSLEIAEKISYTLGKATAQYVLGVISFEQREYANAFDQFSSSLSISSRYNFKNLIGKNQSYLGGISNAQGKRDEALKYCNDALILLSEIQDVKGQVLPQYFLGSIYRNQGLFTESLDHFSKALRLSQQSNYMWGIASSYGLIGTVHGMRGLYSEAMSSFKASLNAWQQLGNKKGIADAHHQLGAVYYYQTNLVDALTNYLISLKLRQEMGDNFKVAESYHDIGHIYLEQGNYDEALINYENALEIFKQAGNKQRMGIAYNSIGNVYTDIGNTEKGIENYEASIQIQEEIGDKSSLVFTYNNVGRLYYLIGDHNAARATLFKGKQLASELEDIAGLAQSYFHLGNNCSSLDSLEQARDYFEKSIELSKATGNKSMLKIAYEQLSNVYSGLNDFPQSLFYYKLHKSYADSIISEEKERVIADLKISYETEKKDLEIRRLENERDIDSLQFAYQHELLTRVRSEKERIKAENLYHLQKIDLLDREKAYQQLQIEKNEVAILAQHTEADRKQDQLTLLNKESEIQTIKLKKQTMLKNYLIGSLLLFALLSFFVYNYFITRQKLKLQTLRNKIATDLHDDVGSTLSSIAIFSEIAQKQSKENIPHLKTIGESSRKMLDAMGDIVWTINPENDHFEKIILRMKSYAYELLGAKKIDFDFQSDNDVDYIKLPMDVRKNLFLVFKEAINNIVKYSEADKALFTVRTIKDQLSMVISDNGIGFNMHEPGEGNGLKNMKKRAEEVGGNLKIDSHPGKGTTIQFNIQL